MSADPIWLPCAALVLVTALVWIKLYADRLGEMRAKRIVPQALASACAAAWSYVGLRALHSLIHVTYNRVVHRFLVYVTSTLLLFGLWIAFLARIFG